MDDAGDVLTISTPGQFRALGHPMRHRLLLALGQSEATISQLAAALGSNKGNVAHHLKVLTAAGLVRTAGTRQVRGGTERYYRRSASRLEYDDADTTAVAFRAIAEEIAAAEPSPLLVLRSIRLTAEHASQLQETLHALAHHHDDGAGNPRYGLLVGFYKPQPPGAAQRQMQRQRKSQTRSRSG
ncbi:MAG: ArsR/SmtB family transcription factor [Streptosporangiaceae bacterium]